jgi:hypothetical protein
MAQYLLKYIDSEGKYTIALSTDVFNIGGLKFHGDTQVFDETSIALKTELANVSGALAGDVTALIAAVSGQVEADFMAADAVLQAAYEAADTGLQNEIDYVSGVVDDIVTQLSQYDEVRIEATAAQTIFSVSGFFSFSTSNNNRDINVHRNGIKMFQSSTGNISGGDFEKISATQIQFFYGLNLGDRVVIGPK